MSEGNQNAYKVSSLSENSSTESNEELLQRHRLEKKQLQANVQQLKKSNNNNNKKRKKEVAEEIEVLENALKIRQEEELVASEAAEGLVAESGKYNEVLKLTKELCLDTADETTKEHQEQQNEECQEQKTEVRVSRAARRRAQKSEAARVREEELQREREYQLIHSERAVEARAMAARLRARNLIVTEMRADGDCMYAALSQQLTGRYSIAELRKLAAQFISSHQTDFLPFLIDPVTGDLLDEEGFSAYCTNIVEKPVWGGQPELRALSQTLGRRIEVIQAEGAPVVVGEEFPSDGSLLLGYYRHCYSLGEHYNALNPATNSSSTTNHTDNHIINADNHTTVDPHQPNTQPS